MTIYLFGVSNVGKTTTGKLLAQRLGYAFYDMDEEVKRYFNTTLEEFVKTGTLEERDKKRSIVLERISKSPDDKVVAVTPIAYIRYFQKLLQREDTISIELRDTPENIFDRLVFSDEEDREYRDDAYKDANRDYYLGEISEDIRYYGNHSFRAIPNKFDMRGGTPDAVVSRLIAEYSLSKPS